MSYIPKISKEEESYLSDSNKDFMCGYDYCVNNDVMSFFDNLEIYYDDLELDDCDLNIGRFLDKRPNVKAVLVDCLKDYIAVSRNEVVSSMLDEVEME